MLNRHLRKLNIILFVLCGMQWFAIRESFAEPTINPFLYNPHYGPTAGYNYIFDHKYPSYNDNPYNGPPNGNCPGGGIPCYTEMINYLGTGSPGYNGHDGIDWNLVYKPVTAMDGGKIDISGWWNASNHETSLGLYTLQDNYNGFYFRYGHLSMVRFLAYPINVGVNWQIGTSGSTGNSTGPHLHTTVLRNQGGGIYKVVDPLGWQGSGNDPWRTLSGAISEPLFRPEPSRVVGVPAELETITVDETSSSFSKTCSSPPCIYWYESNTTGYNGHLFWTYTNGDTPDYSAKWQPSLPRSAWYDVRVYIPKYGNATHAARYYISAVNQSITVVVDQHEVNEDGGSTGRWISLGRYYFNSGNAGYVQLTDATGVHNGSEVGIDRRVLVDAVRWVRATDN